MKGKDIEITDDMKFTLTPKGLLVTEFDDDTVRRIIDTLELYMRRNDLGIAIEGGAMAFVKLQRMEEEDNR